MNKVHPQPLSDRFNDEPILQDYIRTFDKPALKPSDTSVASKPQFGALCPVDTMEIQFTNVGNKGRKGADIAVFTSKGIINTNVTDEFNPFQIDTFRQIFDMYDKNGDNVINVEELRGILEILGYSPSPEEVKTILDRFDQDNSGTIDFDEYLVLIQHWIEQDEEQIYEAFKVFDRDGDGFVSAQELKRALTQYGEQFTEDEANEFFNMMDTDGDGVINYEEFVEYLRSMQKYSTE
ncbi:calmodulin-like isoform X4 [Bolinopsis microptera]|uniref:calmodulin-like isoform X4 n=1 Tax=Bolinopsis microptera TaxID=2820187 RepID=UPI00307AC1AF